MFSEFPSFWLWWITVKHVGECMSEDLERVLITNFNLIFPKSLIKKADQSSLVNSLHLHFIYPFIPAIYPVFVVHDVNIVNQPPRRRPLSLNPTRFLFYRYCVIFFFFLFVSLHWVISFFRMFSSVWLLLLPLVLASSREEHKDIVANTRLRLRFLNDFFLSQIRLGFPRPSEIPEKELKFLLMRALQPPIHNQPKMNVG